jgi:hypothetical protein
MSGTLTWFNSGLGTKTGTAIGNCFADLVTQSNAVSGGADYLWEVKGSEVATTPYYISWGRKDASPGRIALIAWSSSPAGNNSAILDTAPTTNTLYIAYFPEGTGTTLANLTASSGDDDNAVKCATGPTIAQAYTTNFQPFYFESLGGIFVGFQNPAATNIYGCGAGDLLVDYDDDAYGCTLGYGVTNIRDWGSNSTAPCPFVATAVSAGNASTPAIRTNYGSSNRSYFHAYVPSGAWASSAVGASDILTNTSSKDVYWPPVQLIGQTKGEAIVLKLRQIGWGPGTSSAFFAYTNGATVLGRQFNAATAGGNGFPWFTNDKI